MEALGCVLEVRRPRDRHSRNYLERSVAASGRTLALVRGGEFDPPPLIGPAQPALPLLHESLADHVVEALVGDAELRDDA